jgi:hypothetical protein
MLEQNASLAGRRGFVIVLSIRCKFVSAGRKSWPEHGRKTGMPKILQKLIGLTLLFATVGVACWQALLAL